MHDYAGPFDPDFHPGKLSRAALARLGREYMMVGHLIDRALMPHVAGHLGAAGIERVAIDEWMGASPVYTGRIRRCMGITGDDVPAIMKALQLDVGAPHQYMDFRFAVESPARGTFWLQHCGALLDVEPFGEKQVFSMCHAIEDPTFDATATATNPRARIRPIHRPPRVPADRMPHCHWSIEIDPAAVPIPEVPITGRVRSSRLARLVVPHPPDAEPGGRRDYAGDFDPDFQLEDLSHGTLVMLCGEFLAQSHLIVRAAHLVITERAGRTDADADLAAQWTGVARVGTERLCRAMGITGDDAAAVLKALQLGPSFPAPYARAGFALIGAHCGRFWLEDSDALHEEEPAGWLSLLDGRELPALDAAVQAVNPRARCRRVEPTGAARHAWEVVIDEHTEPAPDPEAAKLVRLSGSATFRLQVPR
jgi:hypothetical protein